MAYKWHHVLVSFLCVCALAVIVSSLVSTFNTLHSTKKKRSLIKRSVISEANESSGALNVMEMNQFHKVPTTDHESLAANNSGGIGGDLMAGSVRVLTPVSKELAKNITEVAKRELEIAQFKLNKIKPVIKRNDAPVLESQRIQNKTNTFNKNTTSARNIILPNTRKVLTQTSVPKAFIQSIKAMPVHKSAAKFDHGVEVPVFPTDYHSSGLIILPNSGIAEPFEIWYAPSVRKSRIDYYYGTDKTFQRGDEGEFGVAYKYVPMYNDIKKSFDGCWLVKGRENRIIVPQIITPNMTWFKYNKTEVYTGTMTTKWTYEYNAYGMKNFQSVWITKSKPYRPIRYEMLGFDMMLGSYYDNYVIEYITFDEWDLKERVFEIPTEIKCFEWGNSLEASLMVNPMQEFTAFSPEAAVNHTERYQEFKEQHYKDEQPEDEHLRKHVFKHNARYINSHNRQNLPFKLKPNQFADKLEEELTKYHGALEKDNKNHKGEKKVEKLDLKKTSSHPIEADIPEQLDWRDFGAVSSVKGQGICGSCYAFSAAEATEGAWYRKTSNRVGLSTQQLIDCSWGSGNHGCKGGHYAAALSWIYLHGISTSKSYGKYLGQEGYCHFNDTWFGSNIDGFFYVPIWNTTALKRVVAMHGPVAISINTRPMSFKFYSHGIYDDVKCLKNETTHSALVVGYGKKDGKEFWTIKNSWSQLWGESGFMRISMENDLCGVTEYPVAVIVNHPSFVFPKTKPIDNDDDEAPKVKAPSNIDLLPKESNLKINATRPQVKNSKDNSNNDDNGDDDVDTEGDDDDDDNDNGVDTAYQRSKPTKLPPKNVTIPLVGLHISSAVSSSSGYANDMKKFHEILNDDAPNVFEDYETKEEQPPPVVEVKIQEHEKGEIKTLNQNKSSGLQIKINGEEGKPITEVQELRPHLVVHKKDKILNLPLIPVVQNDSLKVKKLIVKANITRIFQDMSKSQVTALLSIKPIKLVPISKAEKKAESNKNRKTKSKTNKKKVKGKKQQQDKKQSKSKKKTKKVKEIKKKKPGKKEEKKKIKKKENQIKAVSHNELLERTKEINDLIDNLDDSEFSNENTEHSDAKLIKTHKHSLRFKLNPENIGSLVHNNPEKDRPKEATDKDTTKKEKDINEIKNAKETSKQTLQVEFTFNNKNKVQKKLSQVELKKKGDQISSKIKIPKVQEIKRKQKSVKSENIAKKSTPNKKSINAKLNYQNQIGNQNQKRKTIEKAVTKTSKRLSKKESIDVNHPTIKRAYITKTIASANIVPKQNKQTHEQSKDSLEEAKRNSMDNLYSKIDKAIAHKI